MSLYENIAKFNHAVVLPVLLAINGLILTNQWSTSKDMGEHGAKIDGLITSISELKADFKSSAERLQDKVGSTIDDVRKQLAKLESTIDTAQSDPRKILLSMNMVRDDDVFSALVRKNEIWIVPSASLRKRLEKEGRVIQAVTDKAEVYGFKMYTLAGDN